MGSKTILKKFFTKKSTIVFICIIAAVVISGIMAPVIAPHDPLEQELGNKFLMPSLEYPMGTDNFGRCIFSRILYATRIKGGIVDTVIMRICDVLYAFPSLVLVMAIVGIFGTGIFNVILAMLIMQWLWYARVVRNLTASEKCRSYISAAKVCGTNNMKIIFSHIFPNIIPYMIAVFTVDFGHTILSISGYSFLGLGVQPPDSEWGAMISDGRSFINTDPWLMFWPGIMILATVVIVNILGDHMRDALDSQAV